MQPTFVLSVGDSVDPALAKLRRAIESPELAGHAESAGPCLDFKIAPHERRLWSPHLSVQLSEIDAGTELYCRFSPRPEIWTGVMASYFGAVFAILVAAVYGYVQWYLSEDVGETVNLAAKYPAKLRELVALASDARVPMRPQREPQHPMGQRFN